MPTELEELVSFIGHPNPNIRLPAAEHLVPYSASQPSIFKIGGSDPTPIKHLKILVQDHPKIAEHALTILVNLSADRDVLENLATDDTFLKLLLRHVIDPEEPNANLLAMLLANLAKHTSLVRIASFTQEPPEKLASHTLILNQLVDLFTRGSEHSYNKDANYHYLSYLLADLSTDARIRAHLVTRQNYDGLIPLAKIKPFTSHPDSVRRKGVASCIKNTAFEVSAHPSFLTEDEDSGEIAILPYVLLPIMSGSDHQDYSEEEMDQMLPDLQLLEPDHQRDGDYEIVRTHLETLMLLTTTRQGRELMRKVQVYPVIRETHKSVENDSVREACERLVQVLMRDEALDDDGVKDDRKMITGKGDIDTNRQPNNTEVQKPRVVEVNEDEDDILTEV